MHATTIISTLLLALSALATPVPDATHQLSRRANTCKTDGAGVKGWVITLDDDASYNKQCGGGCLDNIRGRCGVVTTWGCSRDAAGTATYHFYTTHECTEWDMTQALKACTKGEQTIDCNTVSTPL